MAYTKSVEFYWDEADAAYISSRSSRCQGALDIEPGWTQEVLEDERLVVLDPYPASRIGASGFIGHSASAGACSW